MPDIEKNPEEINYAGCYQWYPVERELSKLNTEKLFRTISNFTPKLPRYIRKINTYDLNSSMDFGKYKEKTISDILNEDVDYIEWCLTKQQASAYLNQHWRY